MWVAAPHEAMIHEVYSRFPFLFRMRPLALPVLRGLRSRYCRALRLWLWRWVWCRSWHRCRWHSWRWWWWLRRKDPIWIQVSPIHLAVLCDVSSWVCCETHPRPLLGEAEIKMLRVRRQHCRGAGRGELLCFSHRAAFTIPATFNASHWPRRWARWFSERLVRGCFWVACR